MTLVASVLFVEIGQTLIFLSMIEILIIFKIYCGFDYILIKNVIK